jgi:hypothetical protein
MDKRKLQGISGGACSVFQEAGKVAVILSLALFTIEPAVWAKTKTEVMECTMQNGKIVDRSGRPIGDCILMKDGQMMMMTKGKMTPIKKDITLADGTVCKVDGTCILKNGKQTRLSNGEGLEVAGEKLFVSRGWRRLGAISNNWLTAFLSA